MDTRGSEQRGRRKTALLVVSGAILATFFLFQGCATDNRLVSIYVNPHQLTKADAEQLLSLASVRHVEEPEMVAHCSIGLWSRIIDCVTIDPLRVYLLQTATPEELAAARIHAANHIKDLLQGATLAQTRNHEGW